MLDIKKFAVVSAEAESEETLIVADQELIAHVHSERYAALFAAAPGLLSVVNEFAAGPCEVSARNPQYNLSHVRCAHGLGQHRSLHK